MTTASPSEFASAEVRAEMARQHKILADLAAVLECSDVTAGRRVNGSIPFRLDELTLVADWLGVPLHRFLPTQAHAAAS